MNALSARVRPPSQEYGRSIDRACDQIIPMARGLLAARRRYRADQDFGRWLEQSPYSNVGHTDRAALIKIGEREFIHNQVHADHHADISTAALESV